MCSSLSAKNKITIVKGQVAVKETKQVILCNTEEAAWNHYDTCNVAADGTFSFTVSNPKEGFWSVVSATKYPYMKPYHVQFYLKAGDNIEMQVEQQWNNYSFDGKLSKENGLLQKWNKIYSEMFDGFQTYKVLYPKVEKFLVQTDEMKNEIKGSNKTFNQLMRKVIDWDTQRGMLNFKMSPNSIHPTKEEIHPIYAEILSNQQFDDDTILNYPFGSDLIYLLVMEKSRDEVVTFMKDQDKSQTRFDICVKYVTSNKLKAVYFIHDVHYRYKTYEDFEIDYKKYGHLLWSDGQKAKVKIFADSEKPFLRGNPAFDFTYPDVTGKMYSLSDFKGKVVLVDVWATWCGPCRAEFPALKNLEKELHGEKIVFIGVSVDTQAKKQDWVDMVKKEGLQGIQLFANGFDGGTICKDYKITGIPRFMVFDKRGNIYSVNATRPSDPELKNILLKLAAE